MVVILFLARNFRVVFMILMARSLKMVSMSTLARMYHVVFTLFMARNYQLGFINKMASHLVKRWWYIVFMPHLVLRVRFRQRQLLDVTADQPVMLKENLHHLPTCPEVRV